MMRTIEATATVTEDGRLIVSAPPDVPAGQHRVVVVIEEDLTRSNGSKQRRVLDLPAHDLGLVDDTFTFRREDIYDD